MTLVYHLYDRHFVTWSQEEGEFSYILKRLTLPQQASTAALIGFPVTYQELLQFIGDSYTPNIS